MTRSEMLYAIMGKDVPDSAAKHWAAHDPYALKGVFQRVDVKPLLETLP